MKFCEKCDSKLIKTKIGEKCPKCDKESLKQIKENLEKDKVIIPFSVGQEFPFEKNQHYEQKVVRKTLGCDLMSGINYNKEGNFLVIFMNAHGPKTSQNNPYYDYYEPNTGLYHYIGKGKKGDQTLTGVNGVLEKSNENNTEIHFFMQQHLGGNHQYIGKVKLEKTIPTIQPDVNSKNRKVYKFLLRPTQ